MDEHTYVDRYIDLMTNPSRPGLAVLYLPMSHLSLSAREDYAGGGGDLGQRTERSIGRRG